MRLWKSILATVLITCAVLVFTSANALAHVPQFAEGGTTLETATLVDQPATSWVYYGTIQPGEARYYRLDLAAGDRLYVQVLTPRQGPWPGLAVMGPDLAGVVPASSLQAKPPSFVTVPPGSEVIVEQGGGDATAGKGDTAEYEPFTPGAYWYPATVDIRVAEAGSYYVAVFSEAYSGPYGIAVGYEERYTIPAWIRLPVDLLTIYAWDGGWAVALLPGMLVLILGMALVVWRARAGRREVSPSNWLALAAGVCCLTTSVTVLVQMLRAADRSGFDPAMGITAVFILGPAVIGGLLLWLGWRGRGVPGVGTRIGFLALGIAGLVLLAGYFVGPALAIVAAAAPPYRAKVSEGGGLAETAVGEPLAPRP
jgi:hypothetical protein